MPPSLIPCVCVRYVYFLARFQDKYRQACMSLEAPRLANVLLPESGGLRQESSEVDCDAMKIWMSRTQRITKEISLFAFILLPSKVTKLG